MAKLIDFGGSVDSNLVEGIGTNSVTFTMPGNIGIAVESVFASVNNTAGADTGATLTVTDQSGKVIAKQRQSNTLDAGVTGSATWALRLGGDGASGVVATWARYQGTTSIAPVPGGGSIDFNFVDGTALLDLTNPFIPLVLKAGTYAASMTCDCVGITTGAIMQATLQLDPYSCGRAQATIIAGGIGGANTVNPTGFMKMVAGAFLNNIVRHNQAGAENFHHVTDIVRFAPPG